ncbi:hypothetical protein JW823_03035 [bacterium]|nr:hypothetical protein [candidate division CSSED10-310 bacterium]
MMIRMNPLTKTTAYSGITRISGEYLCLVILTVSMLIPLWTPDLLPFTDYPVHLALVQAAGSPGRAQSQSAERFETHWFTPYAIPYQVMRWIAVISPIETAGKLLLSVYLIATPLLFIRLFRALGKPGYLALPVFLMLYNFNIYWGFLPFLTAIPLLIEIMTQSVSIARNPSGRRIFLLTSLFIILFFTHLFALLIGIACCVSTSLIGAWKGKKISLLMLLCPIPALCITLVWRMTLQFNSADQYFLRKGIRMAPFSLKFRFLPDYIISGDPGWTSRIIFFILLVMIGLRLIPRKKMGNDGSNMRDHVVLMDSNSGTNKRLALGLVVTIWLLYFICPYSWLTAVWLFNRLAFLAAALTLTLLPSDSRFSRQAWIMGITLSGIILSWTITDRHLAFDREARSGLGTLHRIPPGERLRFLPFNARSAYCDHTPYEHFGQYYQLHQNGSIYNPFAVLTHMPIRYARQWMATEASFRPEIRRTNSGIEADLAVNRNDYFLIRLSPDDTPDKIGRLFLEQLHQLPDIVYQESSWLLLARSGEQ